MNLQTQVEIAPFKEKITYQDKILFLGSCFATEVGTIMKDYQFDVVLNPFGVLYNPASICSSLERLESGKPFTQEDVICSQGKFTSFFHHSSFSKDTSEEFLLGANKALSCAKEDFAKASICVITLGTAWVFRHIERNLIVSNCHKIVAKEFRREHLDVETVVELFSTIISRHSDKKWIFTVSPIRHLKDGAHGNQISKATLLLAVEQLEQRFSNVHYFPAYEIMMDELRDYRFYEENMTHPSQQAINYIFEKFKECAIAPTIYEKMLQVRKELKARWHIKLI